jgi:hypothetical protein
MLTEYAKNAVPIATAITVSVTERYILALIENRFFCCLAKLAGFAVFLADILIMSPLSY